MTLIRKYNNRKVKLPNGDVFDSKGEFLRWQELLMLERAGKIRNLQRQVSFELIPSQKTKSGKTERKTTYIADFTYETESGMVVEDYKGFKTPEYRLKKKLMLYRFGVEILETKR